MMELSKDFLEEIIMDYFDGYGNSDDLREFDDITPNGNHIKGVIYSKHNHFLGSLLILEVNDEPVRQFVQAFPKIHYIDPYHKLEAKEVNSFAFEKLDGSCVGVYCLKLPNGNYEIVQKSRNRPILDKHFQSMYDLCDTMNINKFFEDEENRDCTLFFELYGMKNLHFIEHMNTYIDLALIGCYYPKPVDDFDAFISGGVLHGFLNGYDLIKVGYHYGFNCPKELFCFHKFNNKVVLWIEALGNYKNYLDGDLTELKEFDYVEEAIEYMKELLEEINRNYYRINHRYALEGVVINGFSSFGDSQEYIKVKPKSIENKARAENGVPNEFINKEIRKFLDEYGDDKVSIYENDKDFIIDYVKDGLGEEWGKEYLENPKTNKKIINQFLKLAKLHGREAPPNIQNIAHDLINRYPNKEINDLMRIFAQENPLMKKDAHDVYNVLEKIMK